MSVQNAFLVDLAEVEQAESIVYVPTAFNRGDMVFMQWHIQSIALRGRQFYFPLAGEVGQWLIKPSDYKIFYVGQIKDLPNPNNGVNVLRLLAKYELTAHDWIVMALTTSIVVPFENEFRPLLVALPVFNVIDINGAVYSPHRFYGENIIIKAFLELAGRTKRRK